MSGIYFFVDRVESGIAVLLAEPPGDGEILMRVDALPRGTREGTWLRASLEIDAGRMSEARRDIESLLGDLGDEP
jgi:hypothetical protein